LMLNRPEVIRGIMRVLVERIRGNIELASPMQVQADED
jgi:hypothetical protein